MKSGRKLRRCVHLRKSLGIYALCLLILFIIVNCIGTYLRCKQPHIIFILVDDYGFNDVGYHGSEIHTPILDTLAGHGVRLENYYVQPMCTPTRSQLMSGRYQIHTGLQHGLPSPVQPTCLPVSLPTLPDKLKAAGYDTHMVGKWHLGHYKKECLPTRRGFDSFFGSLTGREDHYDHTIGAGILDLRENEIPATAYNGTYSTHMFTQRAQQIIEQHNSDKPMFLYLAYNAVHTPLQVPKQYTEPYFDIILDENRLVMAGMVSCMDEGIGNITQTLRDADMWKDTIIVFSTDNGGAVRSGASNWPLRGQKNTIWEGGIRGIGFVSSPLLPADVRGTVNRKMIHVSDWFPTLVTGVAGMDLNTVKLDGYNVWKAISSKETSSPRKEILHDIDPFFMKQITTNQYGIPCTHYDTYMHAAIRNGDWKLVTGKPAGYRFLGWTPPPDSGIPTPSIPLNNRNIWLFNITSDPYEYNDVSSKYPEVVAELVDKLKSYQKTAVPVVYPADEDTRADPELGDGAVGPWE